ncbi:MAG: ribosomal RNA small subunit methyltransferase A [Nanohaloarchaea archaeon SW_7_43_1]|nr:MAG: ribosomal RNA small subunit methyltransferase A [Nanohaloarchaea archaeon SW_7_43_1]
MDTEKTLRELGIKPVKGQNFLISEIIVEALVEAGEVEDKQVLEIGAGTGAITSKLSKKAEKVYAVENNSVLANHLKEEFVSLNLEVVEEDILEYDFENIDRCVANIPFHLSSEIIEELGQKQVQSALIIQEDLADRIVAEPGEPDYGRFTVLVNYYFIPVKLRKVPASSFKPAPDVNAAIIKLYPNRDRHGVENEDFFFKIVRALFTHKGKKTRNAFVDARHILDITKDEAKNLRDELPNSEKRVNNLKIIELKEIADFLQDRI